MQLPFSQGKYNCRYFSAADSYVKVDTTSAKENINAYPEIRPRRRRRVMRSEKQ